MLLNPGCSILNLSSSLPSFQFYGCYEEGSLNEDEWSGKWFGESDPRDDPLPFWFVFAEHRPPSSDSLHSLVILSVSVWSHPKDLWRERYRKTCALLQVCLRTAKPGKKTDGRAANSFGEWRFRLCSSQVRSSYICSFVLSEIWEELSVWRAKVPAERRELCEWGLSNDRIDISFAKLIRRIVGCPKFSPFSEHLEPSATFTPSTGVWIGSSALRCSNCFFLFENRECQDCDRVDNRNFKSFSKLTINSL